MLTCGAISDTDHLVEAVRAMLRAGRPAAARPFLAALSHLTPRAAIVAELQSSLAVAEDDIPAAIAALDRGLVFAPGNANLRKRRAGLRQRAGDTTGALADALEALAAAPGDASAKGLLGLLLTEVGQSSSALLCLEEATALDPENVSLQLGLAEAAERVGDSGLARRTLESSIKQCPRSAEVRAAAMRLALRMGNACQAVEVGEAARRAGVVDAALLRLLAEAAAARGRSSDAIAAVVEARQLDPTDPSLRHCAAAAGVLPATERAPIGAVRTVFDAMARRLHREIRHPGNQLPSLLHAAVVGYCSFRGASARLGPALDLGCGAGCAAATLADLPIGPFVGVDIAPEMLALAASTGLYTEVIEADLLEFLADEERCFPLILATDVLCWFGPVDGVFSALAARLARRGVIVFSDDATSAATGTEAGWTLRPDGRYAHAIAELVRAATSAGLVVRSLVESPLHNEGPEPVPGLLGVLGRAADE